MLRKMEKLKIIHDNRFTSYVGETWVSQNHTASVFGIVLHLKTDKRSLKITVGDNNSSRKLGNKVVTNAVLKVLK